MMSLEIIQQFEERQKQLEQRLEEQSLLIKEQILQNESLKRQLGHALTHAHLLTVRADDDVYRER